MLSSGLPATSALMVTIPTTVEVMVTAAFPFVVRAEGFEMSPVPEVITKLTTVPSGASAPVTVFTVAVSVLGVTPSAGTCPGFA